MKKEKFSEKIRAASEKSSVEKIRAISVVNNDAELGENMTREVRQTTAAKYTKQWKIMR